MTSAVAPDNQSHMARERLAEGQRSAALAITLSSLHNRDMTELTPSDTALPRDTINANRFSVSPRIRRCRQRVPVALHVYKGSNVR